MGTSFANLLQQLVDARDAEYRSNPERDAARLDAMESILQTTLEMLRDRLDP
jgi:hypothetical protein